LSALGLGHIRGKVRWFLLAILLIYGTISVDFWRYKQPWREMVADTVGLIADGTPILFELGGDDYAPRYHYGNALDDSFDYLLDEGTASENANVLYGLTTWRHLQPESYGGNLPALIDSQNHWWLFYWSSDTGALGWLDTFGFERSATLTVDFNPDVYLYRYDRLPESPIASYGNGLILRDALVHDDMLIELLWSIEEPLDTAYTTSAYLLDTDGQLVAQYDSQPFLGERPMTGWQIDEVIYDPKPLEATRTLTSGDYMVYVVVYEASDGEIIRLETIAHEESVTLGEISVEN
jgi:hypothetical protein